MTYSIAIHSLTEMRKLAERIAAFSLSGDIITLTGEVGMGKTEFARAFIRYFMGSAEEVPSPTFNLVQTYDSKQGMIWHFDLYRLEYPEEIWELGFEEALSDGIVLIEWPERLRHMHLSRHLAISLESYEDAQKRLLTFYPDLEWDSRINALLDRDK